MKLCSPRSHPLRVSLGTADRPRSLEGLRIGFLDNTKAPVDKMMAHLEQRLRERIPGIQAFHISKQNMGVPATPEALQALRQNADVVINALGD